MMKLGLILILFSVGYLKEVLIPETNEILKDSMDLVEFILCIECCFYVGFWVGIYNRRDYWSTKYPNMSEGVPFILNNYMSRNIF